MTSLRTRGVGIDYDGTIADTGALKSAWIREHLDMDVPPWKTDRTLCVPIIGEANYERMGRVVYAPDATLKAPEVPGASKAIHALSARFRVYVVTARNAEQMAWSQRWLEEHGLKAYIEGYLSSGQRNASGERLSKAQLCHAHNICILVDDDQRHLLAEGMAACRRILLKAGSDEHLKTEPGIELATSWNAVLTLLADEGDT